MNRFSGFVISVSMAAMGLLFPGGPAGSAEAASATPETIILISLDTTRADHLSCYGYEYETTPNIDALAKESLFFEHPFAPVPMTLPSHSSMFTGLIPPAHGVHGNIRTYLPASAVTLPEIMRKQGYTTYGIVSTSVLRKECGLNQGFDLYDDAIKADTGGDGRMESPEVERNGKETTERALQWLSRNAEKKKFMFIHYFDPHDLYEPPAPFDERFADPYDGEIAFTDHCVGQILERLKSLDLYDKALIGLVGDHGELLGEHGEDTHSYFIYQNAIRVPMMFKPPGGIPAKRVQDPSSIIDVTPTLLSMASLTVPPLMQGVDLSRYLRPDFAMPNRPIYNESMTAKSFDCSSLLGLIMGRWHYIQTNRPELYDRLKDPEELDNLALQEPEQASAMKEELRRVITDSGYLNAANTNVEMDAATVELLESLGYLDGGNVVVDFSFDEGEHDAKDMISVWNRLRLTHRMVAGGEEDRAIDVCTEVIKEYPNVRVAYDRLVSVYTKRGLLDKSVEVLEQMRARFPKHSADLLRLGEVYSLLEDYDKAIAAVEEALAMKPDDDRSYGLLVAIYRTQGAFDKALATLERRRALLPDNAQTLFDQGTIYRRINDAPNALKSFLGALEFESKSVQTLVDTARTFLDMGNKKEALSYFELALNEDTSLRDVHMMVARLRLSKKNPQLYDPPVALEHAKRAMQLCEDKNEGQCDDLAIFEVAAVAWAANGNFDEAIGATSRTVELCESKGLSAQAEKMKRRIEKYKRQKQERK